MIIGPCGSGKSTLARQLQELTSLPLYHLDQYYWNPNWEETEENKWYEIIESSAAKDK